MVAVSGFLLRFMREQVPLLGLESGGVYSVAAWAVWVPDKSISTSAVMARVYAGMGLSSGRLRPRGRMSYHAGPIGLIKTIVGLAGERCQVAEEAVGYG